MSYRIERESRSPPLTIESWSCPILGNMLKVTLDDTLAVPFAIVQDFLDEALLFFSAFIKQVLGKSDERDRTQRGTIVLRQALVRVISERLSHISGISPEACPILQ